MTSSRRGNSNHKNRISEFMHCIEIRAGTQRDKQKPNLHVECRPPAVYIKRWKGRSQAHPRSHCRLSSKGPIWFAIRRVELKTTQDDAKLIAVDP
eukprot:scaffold175463_cov20-Prasinocladus_malaysianus.AAC.1